MNENTITFAALANEFNMEPFAVAAALDIEQGSDNSAISGYTADEAREILSIMAEQAADLEG